MKYEPVTIEIEPECIRIINCPGIDRSVPDAAIKEGMRFRSRYYRNRRLGEFLHELDLCEGHCTGIPTIQEELEKNGSPAAVFDTDSDRQSICVTIPIHGSYKLYNYFDKECGFTVDKEGKIPTSQYTIFRREDYLSISNMDFDVLIDSYKKYDSDDHIERVNMSILEIIHAYDKDSSREDLLEAAETLSMWLRDKFPDNENFALNYLQCIKRKRELANDEIKQLNKIIAENIDDKMIQFASNVLLGNSKVAQIYFEDMAENEKEFMKSTPIYNLFRLS